MDEHTHKTNNLQEEYSNPKHSVRHKQIERKIRKKRKKISQAKAFLRFVTLLLLVFLSYEFFKLPQWYLNPKAFKKADGHTVEIVNNKIIPTYIINKSLINVKVSRLPIFMVSVKPIKKEIFKQSVIKKVYVRRYGFPARVQIIVEERVPIALIKTDLKAKPVALFTEDGKLLEAKSYMNLPNDDDILKILTSATNLKKDWSVKRVREIEEVVKAVEEYSDEQVEYIDMRNPNDVFVKIKTTSIRLGALDSTVFERIKRIYTILPQVKGVDSHIKYIDLSWDKVNYLKLDKKK